MTDILGELLEGVAATVSITLGAFALGAVLALALVAGTTSHYRQLRVPTRFVVDLIRAVPPIVWLFLIFYGLAQGIIVFAPYPAAVLGLGLVSAAYIAEIYRAGLLAVRRGQREAAQALGLNRRQASRWVIGPQAAYVVLPGLAAWAVSLLKETAVVSIIGVSDITFIATSAAQRSDNSLTIFIIAGILYLVLSLPVALVARWADARVTRGLAR
jgi:His/Glu/Gln/Arg/opine family amino acid ABC transporter permease subunit